MRLQPHAFLATTLLMTMLGVGAATHGQTPAPAAKPATPVVVELFTSEGCSSCPPADDVLAALVKEQPVKGVQVIALGEHVDYWDRLGWKDRFSSNLFTARQNDYAQRVFHTDNIYTPQLIVNGEQQVVGSDARKVKQAIAKAAERPASVTLALTVPAEPATNRKALIQLKATPADGPGLDEPADIIVAVTEENLMTRVLRGENQGLDMRHGTVVRIMAPVGTMTAADGAWSSPKPIAVEIAQDWNLRQLRVIALAQGQKSRRILGASIAPLVQAAAATASR